MTYFLFLRKAMGRYGNFLEIREKNEYDMSDIEWEAQILHNVKALI